MTVELRVLPAKPRISAAVSASSCLVFAENLYDTDEATLAKKISTPGKPTAENRVIAG